MYLVLSDRIVLDTIVRLLERNNIEYRDPC